MFDLLNSNKEIIKLIEKNKPFSIVRLGIGSESYLTFEYIITNKINIKYLDSELLTLYNAGIYSNNKDLEMMKLFCDYYNESIKNCDMLASFNELFKSTEAIIKIQNFFSKKYNLIQVYSRILEPFYTILENEIPWTYYLKNKKILIIHPFINSFKSQIKNNFKMFKNKKIFLDEQEFIFYKPYQTIAGNHIHNNWFETFKLMCNDIEKLDFDIALLGCGGYGLPLCNFIKTELKKSAIYIGGGLQLLFGVTGRRWDQHSIIKEIIKKSESKFIRPSTDEICNNFQTIEGGCYW